MLSNCWAEFTLIEQVTCTSPWMMYLYAQCSKVKSMISALTLTGISVSEYWGILFLKRLGSYNCSWIMDGY